MLLATWRPTSPSLAPMSAGSGIRGAGVVVVVVVVEVARLRICVREEIALLMVSRSKLGSDGNWGAAVGGIYIYYLYYLHRLVDNVVSMLGNPSKKKKKCGKFPIWGGGADPGIFHI